MFKNNKGISLITLIITVIVIIILAAVVLFNGLNTPDKAIFSNFTDEMSNIRVSLANVRAKNLAEHGDENYGFTEVIVNNAHERFISFSADSSEDIGYLIDLSLLDFRPTNRGKGGAIGNQVTFGKEDVYVYDKNGTVYYVSGVMNNGKTYYNAVAYEE